MNEQQLQQIIQQLPPEVLYAIIQMVVNATPEELRELIEQLQKAMQDGGMQQGAAPQEDMESVSGNSQLFGA